MAINQKEGELYLYSINENEHIGAINSTTTGKDTYAQIVVLDSSLAAGNEAARFVKEILPLIKSKMKNWWTLRLITFGADCVLTNSPKLNEFNLKCGGAANFAPAIEKLRLHLEENATRKDFFDLITISAGEINDHENAQRETKKLTDFLAKSFWKINSQAVRLFTPSNSHQPDTKALSYLLQINNSTPANICDVNVTSSNEMIADQIAALFPENVHAYTYAVIDVGKPIASRFPWKSFESNFFFAKCGWNIFWLKQLLTKDAVKFEGKPINVVVEGQLTLAKFQQLMEKKLPQIISHLTILKIVGTAEANETVNQIFSYFAKTEDALAVKCSTPNNKVITNALADIAMFKPDFRTSAEMIEFHRNPAKAIEKERRKQKEEEERLKQEEAERLKQKEVELLKKEEADRLKKEEADSLKQQEAERLKQEEEAERLKQEEADRLKQQEAERLKEEEEAAAAHNSDSAQMVFILDDHSSGANENRRFTEKIVPMMLSKIFDENWQLVHSVTLLRPETTTAKTLQSLVQTLDATKRIRISVLTRGTVHDQRESENFAEKIIEFLNGSGYAFELQVVSLAVPEPTTKRYKVVDISAAESNEFIAEQIVSMSLQ